MKKIVLLAIPVLAILMLAPTAPAFASKGAMSLPLSANWLTSNPYFPVPPPDFGKVIVNQPSGATQLTITVVLQNAAPDTTYYVGFDITYASNPTGTFGQLTAAFPGSGWGYTLGYITTDDSGAGSTHLNVYGITPGSYQMIFWVISPAGVSYGLWPLASTGYWDLGQFTTLTF